MSSTLLVVHARPLVSSLYATPSDGRVGRLQGRKKLQRCSGPIVSVRRANAGSLGCSEPFPFQAQLSLAISSSDHFLLPMVLCLFQRSCIRLLRITPFFHPLYCC